MFCSGLHRGFVVKRSYFSEHLPSENSFYQVTVKRSLSTSSTPKAAAENCWNHGDSQARSRLPLRPA